ncbi:hypothetical protein ACFQY4_42530 [Catellatospora bangladeshensis]|uniref:hypothetical protein n=1 Tax=Catellatospora bangladeshensis TaxID=310355 RepID=UPI0036239E23
MRAIMLVLGAAVAALSAVSPAAAVEPEPPRAEVVGECAPPPGSSHGWCAWTTAARAP